MGPRPRPHLAGSLGFLTGLATTIPAVLLLTALGLPFGVPTVVAVMLAIAGAAALALRRRPPDARELRVTALWAAAATAVSLLASAVNVAYLTYDSHMIVALGRVLSDDGGFGHGLLHELGDRGPFQVVCHAIGEEILGNDFLYALYPVIGVSLIAAFATMLSTAMRLLGVARPAVLVALVTAAAFSVSSVDFHFIYVHENLATAAFLTLFVGMFWLAEAEEDGRYATLGFLALAACALQRIENPLTASLFAALATLPSRLPRRALVPGFALFVAIVAGWNLLLLVRLPSGAMRLDASRCLAMAAAPAAVLVAWAMSRGPRLARWAARAPVAIAAVLALALTYAFMRRTSTMESSLAAMLENLTSLVDWGAAWYAIAILAVLGLVAPTRPPSAAAFQLGVPLYLGFVLFLSYLHGSYIVAWTDSSMRMALHVLPLGFFYAGLQLACVTAGAAAPRSRGTSGTPPPS